MSLIRRIAALTALLVLAGPLSLMFGADKTQTLTGTLSDAMCGVHHMMGDPAKCTRECVKEGAAYSLVVNNKVYTLSGKTDGLDALAGQKATVTGVQQGDKFEVKTVVAAK